MTNVNVCRTFVGENVKKGGNPVGVVHLDAPMDAADKGALFKKTKLAEVAFVESSAQADAKITFYTNVGAIPVSGHGTLAAFTDLLEAGKISGETFSMELEGGAVLAVAKEGENIFLEQLHPSYEEPAMEDVGRAIASLGISMQNVIPTLMPMIVETSYKSLLVGVNSEDALKDMQPNDDMLKALSADMGVEAFYVFTHNIETADFATRMFAPILGVSEEAASGTLAGGLAAYAYDLMSMDKTRYVIEQGRHMKPSSPSTIHVNVDADEERRFFGPRVGGLVVKDKSMDV